MVDETHILPEAAIMHRLLQGIEDEPCVRRGADTPADDLAGIGVDDEGNINEASPSGDIGEVADPEHVGCWHPELPVHPV